MVELGQWTERMAAAPAHLAVVAVGRGTCAGSGVAGSWGAARRVYTPAAGRAVDAAGVGGACHLKSVERRSEMVGGWGLAASVCAVGWKRSPPPVWAARVGGPHRWRYTNQWWVWLVGG